MNAHILNGMTFKAELFDVIILCADARMRKLSGSSPNTCNRYPVISAFRNLGLSDLGLFR